MEIFSIINHQGNANFLFFHFYVCVHEISVCVYEISLCVYLCVCMRSVCVYTYICVRIVYLMCRSSASTMSWDKVSYLFFITSYPASLWTPMILLSLCPSHHRSTGITTNALVPSSMCVVGSNSGPHVCVASAFPTEPSPNPQNTS